MTTPLRPTGLRIKRTRRPRGPGVAARLRPYMWKKGQSGNPSGYNSVMYNLATLVRRTSGDGAELVAFYFAVLRGEPFAVVGTGRRQHPTLDQRLVAAAWLADRGWGHGGRPAPPR